MGNPLSVPECRPIRETTTGPPWRRKRILILPRAMRARLRAKFIANIPSPFFDLPTELRIMIYEELLKMSILSLTLYGNGQKKHSKGVVAFLCASRACYVELKPLLFRLFQIGIVRTEISDSLREKLLDLEDRAPRFRHIPLAQHAANHLQAIQIFTPFTFGYHHREQRSISSAAFEGMQALRRVLLTVGVWIQKPSVDGSFEVDTDRSSGQNETFRTPRTFALFLEQNWQTHHWLHDSAYGRLKKVSVKARRRSSLSQSLLYFDISLDLYTVAELYELQAAAVAEAD